MEVLSLSPLGSTAKKNWILIIIWTILNSCFYILINWLLSSFSFHFQFLSKWFWKEKKKFTLIKFINCPLFNFMVIIIHNRRFICHYTNKNHFRPFQLYILGTIRKNNVTKLRKTGWIQLSLFFNTRRCNRFDENFLTLNILTIFHQNRWWLLILIFYSFHEPLSDLQRFSGMLKITYRY